MKWQGMMLALSAGVCLGIGFVVAVLWWFSFLGIALALLALDDADSLRCGFFLGWLTGFVLFTLALYPVFFGTLPLDWFGVSSHGWLQYAAAIGMLAFASAIYACGTGLFGMLSRLPAFRTPYAGVILLPLLWIFAEWSGALIVSIVGIGPGSRIASALTFGSLGYLAANDAVLLQAAWLGGVYALGAIIALVGALVYRSIAAYSWKARLGHLAVIGTLVIIWAIAHPVLAILEQRSDAAQLGAPSVAIAVVSRYAPPYLIPKPGQEETEFEAMRALVAPLRGVDVLIFPEDTAFLRTLNDGAHAAAQAEVSMIGVGGTPPLIIDSEDIRESDGSLRSRVAYFRSAADTVFGYKQMLMPIGEYVPYVIQEAVRIFGGSQLLDTVLAVRGYQPGPDEGVGIVRGVRLAVRFCDEALSPALYRAQVANGANILIDISSQSWFHGSHIVYGQMLEVAKVRAVEEGRWFVQSGNMSPAFVLDEHGRVVAETKWDIPEALQVSVPSGMGETPYVAMGEGIVLFCAVVLSSALLACRIYGNKKHESREP